MNNKVIDTINMIKEIISNEIEHADLSTEDVFEVVSSLSIQNLAFCILMIPPDERSKYINDIIQETLKAAEFVLNKKEENNE